MAHELPVAVHQFSPDAVELRTQIFADLNQLDLHYHRRREPLLRALAATEPGAIRALIPPRITGSLLPAGL